MNRLELVARLEAWTGEDTILWSGGQKLQLMPLDRSFVVGSGDEDLLGLTESEAEEATAELLASSDLTSCWAALQTRRFEDSRLAGLPAGAPSNDVASAGGTGQPGGRLEQFFVASWDTHVPRTTYRPWRFAGFVDALQLLAAYERECDRPSRIVGSPNCSHIGFRGSGDEVSEDLRGERFQFGLQRLGVQALREAYRPENADRLVTLCNWALRTLHLDFAGYAKDLLWACRSEERGELLKALGITEAEWLAWSDPNEPFVDPKGEALAVELTGDIVWRKLLPKTRHFLATALLHLKERGSAPQLDYAPISLEVVKALEVELVRILADFKASVAGQTFPATNKREERSLASFLSGKRPPELGPIAYLLQPAPHGPSQLKASLHSYLATLPNGTFLTSTTFTQAILDKVTKTFRNGGVHDSPIAESGCRDCVTALLGTQSVPGLIPSVVAWIP